MTSRFTWLSPLAFPADVQPDHDYRIDLVASIDGSWLLRLHGAFRSAGSAAVLRGVLARIQTSSGPVHIDGRRVREFCSLACEAVEEAVKQRASSCPVMLDAVSPAMAASLDDEAGESSAARVFSITV